MKTVDERIENLSDELLDNFIKGAGRINCRGLFCDVCPIQTDGGCICVKFYHEKARRLARINKESEENHENC